MIIICNIQYKIMWRSPRLAFQLGHVLSCHWLAFSFIWCFPTASVSIGLAALSKLVRSNRGRLDCRSCSRRNTAGTPLEHRWVWKWGWTTPKQLAIQIGIMRMIQWSLEVPNFKTNPWKNMRNPVGHQWTGSGVSPVTGLIGPNVVACE